ncbi:chaperone protein ClpB1-like [Actinidia eriantha]|uniref:chaperone protein ClpB1-like n=1 Tax=Actinidia eriantha TaxID=165200 RepID=UPI00258F723B|nr:chaperone protein ClpB1-like [Actinidia eriantha]
MPHVTPELVHELQAVCGLLHLAMEAKNLSEIPNLLSEFIDLLHKLDGAIHMKFRDIMTVGQLQVKETMFFRPLDTDKPRVPRAFLFLGASGIGKAELAKAIAVHLYDNVDRLIRVDMSEFTESSLGRLVDTVRSKPYGVILFRKIEKAPSSILDIIIHMLNQGKLIDGKFFEKHDCYLKGSGLERVIEEAKKFLKPELLKLLDNIYVFEKRVSNNPIAWLKLRDMARSKGCGIPFCGSVKSIVSGAACLYVYLLNLKKVKAMNGDGQALNRSLSENVLPMLSKMVMDGKIDDTTAVYIDALVGVRKLSFRLESSENVCGRLVVQKVYKVLEETEGHLQD